ncbi:aspartate aminotransferase family protein [Caldalkalibacillus salinus]|uniref:aspartate aminotransferase family protein n=1 Tax=Caldalkalibacillus salinus TaxID=2803787 RepID=UPI001920A0B7|nr:aspartate aminotransferase family protein [Caldalkalibacillus salinus]
MKAAEPEPLFSDFPISETMYTRAQRSIPGGVSANIKHFQPHPIFMEQAQGSHIWDVDGHHYIDYLLCYGALMTGHGHPRVMQAVEKQLRSLGTTVFGAPHRMEFTLAEKVVSLFPGMDQVRFTNSGLEATLLCLRLAKAYTNRNKTAKFEGHYHGGYNEVLYSISPNVEQAGPDDAPHAQPESMGLNDHESDQTIVLPFNNIVATEQILRAHADDIAAVILEPVQGGFIPAEKAFLQKLRQITKELGIILIFDEVKTGFRITLGGVQNDYEVIPDLTALGKVLGGGFPIGAVGGPRELMTLMTPQSKADVFAKQQEHQSKEDVLFHSGTYNGHPTVLAAGLATITFLEEDGHLQRTIDRTHTLRQHLEELYKHENVPMQTLGMGSMFNIVMTRKPIRNYRDLKHDQPTLRRHIDYLLLKQGIYTKPLNRYSLSTAHTMEDIKATVRAHQEVLTMIGNRHSLSF